ncbi:M13 family metallopeptidase [Bdellovibrio bacteriovorus]|uniref:M13 family metallopeptidase n=1 Tax=Bdellovibrio bacteriovorus TaxID=959 RepID=UPI003AA8978A
MLKLLLPLLVTPLMAQATKPAPKSSSEIPVKREFPLNSEISPCQNFHQYVCSKAESAFKLREDRSRHLFAFSDSRERLLETQMKFMKELPHQKNLDARTAQVRDYYLACMDSTAKARDEKAEVKKLKAELDQIKSLEEFILYTHAQMPRGLGGLIRLWPTNNLDNPKEIDAMLYSSLMELPDHKYYEQKDLMAEYEKQLVLFFQSVDPKIKKADAVRKAQAQIALEQDFIKVFPVTAVRHQRWSEKRVASQKDLVKKYPNLKLDVLFKYAPEKLAVNTPIPESLDFLNAELPKRDLQIWKDAYLYGALSGVMDDGYPKFFASQFAFEKKFFGGPAQRPVRQERCTSEATRLFSKEIDAVLIEKVFPNFDESKVHEVASRIRTSILQGLEKNTWLSKDGKKEALAKIRTARLQLVKPHNDREWDFLPVKKYSTKQAIQNLRTYREARWEKSMQEMREPANMDAWGMSPLTVNAYYSSNENKFVLPIGILQFPFYDKDGSVIENLGAVGAVVGHELGHSIDDSGSKYDSQGRLRTWMTTKDIMEFNLRGQKMIDQFNKADHDGKLTLGENVADLVGLTFAYNAAFPEGKGSEKDKKDFFVAYGRLWCEVIRPDNAKLLRKTDPHSSGLARINEQVKQQPAFAETFQCKPGDPMTLPEKDRVQIW